VQWPAGVWLFFRGAGLENLEFGNNLIAATSGPVPPLIDRLPAYARLDFRFDKNWAFTRWKTTLYGEVLNLTNHNNVFATGLQSGSQQPFMAEERALPVVPTAGLVFEF
jgi:hypothetical protein